MTDSKKPREWKFSIEAIQHRIKRLHELGPNHHAFKMGDMDCEYLLSAYAKLLKQNEIFKKALEFYGNGSHWTTNDHEENIFIKVTDKDWEHRGEGQGFVGGNIAREALQAADEAGEL